MNWKERFLTILKQQDEVEEDLEQQQIIQINSTKFNSDSNLLLNELDFTFISTLNSNKLTKSKVELIKFNKNLLTKSTTTINKFHILKSISIKKQSTNLLNSIKFELKILLLSANQQSIPKLISSFLFDSTFYLVLEFAIGGDLFNLLESVNNQIGIGEESNYIGLNEQWVKKWMLQLIDVLEWLHSNSFAHRDIKPQNLLLNDFGNLLLTDFGSAAPLNGDTSIAQQYAQALIGTPDYIASEILKNFELTLSKCLAEEDEDEPEDETEKKRIRDKKLLEGNERAYGCEIDWWSLGIVIYELLYGQPPFFEERIEDTYKRIVESPKSLTFPRNSTVSKDAEYLIRSLLVPATIRLQIPSEIKTHPWFSNEPFNHLDTSHYIPPPFTLPPTSSNSPLPPSSTQQTGLNHFNHSAFFSSPNLSILRPTNNSTSGFLPTPIRIRPLSSNNKNSKENFRKSSDSSSSFNSSASDSGEDDEAKELVKEREGEKMDDFWNGMTWMPKGDFFDSIAVEREEGEGLDQSPPTLPLPLPLPHRLLNLAPHQQSRQQHQNSFETPLRSSLPLPSSTQSQFQSQQRQPFSAIPMTGNGASNRAKRRLNSVEVYLGMQEIALRTAKKLVVTGSSSLVSPSISVSRLEKFKLNSHQEKVVAEDKIKGDEKEDEDEQEELERIERNRLKILNELYEIEIRLKELKGLA